jgi:hypothetical protein
MKQRFSAQKFCFLWAAALAKGIARAFIIA